MLLYYQFLILEKLMQNLPSDDRNTSKIEEESFAVIKKELLARGIDYICDLGLRDFFKDGSSFGICSNLMWKTKKTTPGFKEVISIFYSNELLKLRRRNYNHSVRVQGQCYNSFLKQISDNGSGNVLVIYDFCTNKIRGYFFLAKKDDFDAVSKFHNDKVIFELVVKSCSEKIEKIFQKYGLPKLAVPLFPLNVINELFPEANHRYKVVNSFGKKATLTKKQLEVMAAVAKGYTRSKEISSQIGVTSKQVDKYFSALKSIFCVRERKELLEIAKHND
jgi:DNA-binding CsgD family transcriptional regulator